MLIKYIIPFSISYLFSMVSLFFPVLARTNYAKLKIIIRFTLQGISLILNATLCPFLYIDTLYLPFFFIVFSCVLAAFSYIVLLIKSICDLKDSASIFDGPHDKESNKSFKEIYCFSIALVLISLIYIIFMYVTGVL